MLRDTLRPLLALVTASMAAALPGAGPGPNEAVIGMNELPSNAKIQDLLRRTDPTRRNQDPRLYDLLFRHLREDDCADLRRCRARVERKRYDHLAGDRLWPRRCQNQMWCPKCSHVPKAPPLPSREVPQHQPHAPPVLVPPRLHAARRPHAHPPQASLLT